MRASLLFALILISCGPAHKLRKAERLIADAVASGKVTERVDTVYVDRIIPGDSIRVEIPIEKVRDTVIERERVRIEIKRIRDIISVKADCPPIEEKTPVKVNRIINCPDCPKDRFWKGFGMGAGALILLLILYGLIRLLKVG